MQKVSFHWLIQKVIAKTYTFTSKMEGNWWTKVNNNLLSYTQKNIYILMSPFQFSIFYESMILYITEYLLLYFFKLGGTKRIN